MVKALHRAGLEVILDVVYNHTAEGHHLGPALTFRGIDNPAYYRLVPDQPRYYQDSTGCGHQADARGLPESSRYLTAPEIATDKAPKTGQYSEYDGPVYVERVVILFLFEIGHTPMVRPNC